MSVNLAGRNRIQLNLYNSCVGHLLDIVKKIPPFVGSRSADGDYEVTQNIRLEDQQQGIKKHWCIRFYYTIVDSVINYLKKRFYEENQKLALVAGSFLNLHYKEALPFISHYEVISCLTNLDYDCN
ncbi:Hypothetical protein CINCED_3A001199 [Cinara cedri]|uniref:Uncharacterized protein n=1 Tax=Cinara cedri TaxID=506608 RepID=A0A5E4NC75_9HEMI|nr:Hypothetical protein CINCED_3A001199 [Cinara cedri]